MFKFFSKKKQDNIEPIEPINTNIEFIEPIESNPTYNLIFHFHCMDHEKIRYSMEKLLEHIHIFTGYKIFTISSATNKFVDNQIFYDIVDKFKAYSNTYFIPVANNVEMREVSHFFDYAMPLLIKLADIPNKKSYTLYAHSKGCTKPEKDYAITCWVNTLYKYNLDLFDSLIKPNLLLDAYKFIGCMKTNVGSTFGAKQHYAGTFFWFDSDIVRLDWYKHRKHLLGLEMWPNTIVDEKDMLSVFDLPLDTNRSQSYYNMDFWYNLVFDKTIGPPTTVKKQQ